MALWFWIKFQHRCRDNAKRSLGTDEQVFQIISRIVLAQFFQAVPNPPIGQNHFQPQTQIPRVAVSQHIQAPRIARKIATDAA